MTFERRWLILKITDAQTCSCLIPMSDGHYFVIVILARLLPSPAARWLRVAGFVPVDTSRTCPRVLASESLAADSALSESI